MRYYIILRGFLAVGKTTIAKKLAKKTNLVPAEIDRLDIGVGIDATKLIGRIVREIRSHLPKKSTAK